MTETNAPRVEEFLRDLKEALTLPSSRKADVIAEVRSDLTAHVERFQSEGKSETEAIDLALAEMGNPYELAHHVSAEVPPFGGKVLTGIRYALAGALVLWTIYFGFMLRGWSYGFQPVASIFVFVFHLPIILLLWPRIVWRKNWLFSLIPVGFGLAALAFFYLVGVSKSTYHSFEAGAPTPPPEPENADLYGQLFIAFLAAASISLIACMQQRAQRLRVIVPFVVAIFVTEAAYQVEEYLFRRDRDRLRAWLETVEAEEGFYPDREYAQANGPALTHSRVGVGTDPETKTFTIYWTRMFSDGFQVCYSQERDEIWIND